MHATIDTLLKHKGARVWTIPAAATVYSAIQLMAARNIGALLVVSNGRVEGLFSERDYTRKVALHGKSSKDTLVREIIPATLVTATPLHTVEECMRLMTEHRVRHLPIMEGGEVLGIVSIGDLVNSIISEQSHEIIQLQSYISGQYPG